MDGTILDSMGMWRGLNSRLIAHFGLEFTQESLAKAATLSLEETAAYYIERYRLGLTPDEVIALWNRMIHESYLTAVSPKEGVVEYLTALKNSGVRLGVATLTNKVHALPALERHGLDKLFEFVLTVQDVGKSKRFPDIYLEAARMLGATAAESVVFEDDYRAIKTAVEAGFPTYAVSDPSSSEMETEIRALCTRYVTSYHDLLKELPDDCLQ